MLDGALAAKSLYWPACLPYGPTPWPAAVRGARYDALWLRDARLAEAIERRGAAVRSGRMAGVMPDGRRVTPSPSVGMAARIREALTPRRTQA